MVQKQKPSDKGFNFGQVFDFCGSLMSRVGTVGFIVIAGVVFVYYFSNESQKKEIIDTWVLMKNPLSINISIGINLIMFAALIFHNYHYKFKVKLLRIRNDEITEEKNSLQEILLKKALNK